MALVILIIIVSVIVVFSLYVKWKQTYWSRRGVPQLENSFPLGNMKALINGEMSQFDFFRSIYQRSKALKYQHVGLYASWIPMYCPISSEMLKWILVKDFPSISERGFYTSKEDVLTNNLFFKGGDDWKKSRVQLTPIFTSGKIKQMFNILLDKAELLNEWVSKTLENSNVIDIKDSLARFTLDNICSVAFGVEFNTLLGQNSELNDIARILRGNHTMLRALEFIVPWKWLEFFGYRFFTAKVNDYFQPRITEAIRYRESGGKKRNDFLEMMLKLKNDGVVAGNDNKVDKGIDRISEWDIIGEAFAIFGAGFETSSSTSSFTIFELAKNQEVQSRLRQEIMQHQGDVTYEVVLNMTYLDLVIKETLRMYPAVPLVTRRCTKDCVSPDKKLTLKKGTMIWIPIPGLHRDPEFFPNPDTFNPDNFLPENIAGRPDVYMPFGIGPRQCIGMRFGLLQSKLAVITMVKNYRFWLDDSMNQSLKFTAGCVVLSADYKVMAEKISS